MYNTITVFFNVNEGARVLFVIFCKRGRDCVGWGICESKADDMVQGLAQNFAGGLAGDESDGVSCHQGRSRGRHLISVVLRFNNEN